MISIIMPTYNRAHTIMQAIQSVLDQHYSDWELIVVDDGSTDDTKNVVEDIVKNDDRVRYLSLKVNGGVSAARNAGIEAAQGNYVAYLDSDNYMYAHWLDAMVDYFTRNPRVTWLYPRLNTTIVDRVNDTTSQILDESIVPEGSTNIDSLLSMDFQADPNGLIHKRTTFASVRWNREIQSYGDYEYALQMTLLDPEGFAVHPFVLGAYIRTYGVNGMCSNRGYADIISGLKYLDTKYETYKRWTKQNGLSTRIVRYQDCLDRGMQPIEGLRKKYGVKT